MNNFKIDSVDLLALVLLGVGLGLFAWGWSLDPPSTTGELVLEHFGDWTPGFVVDGILLLVLNRVIRSSEQRRVIRQVASLSNEFSLDAVRRCREEGWLQSGIMSNMEFAKAKLASADLSEASLAGADLSFADLSTVDLTNADLRGVCLTGANLDGADLRWSNLSGSSLDWSDLRNAQLDGAVLDEANAEFASIDEHYAKIPEFHNAVVGGFLSPRQITVVEASFELLLSKGNDAIISFYERLFATEPRLQALFSTDVDRQSRKFLQSLKVIVSSLGSLERAAPVLHRLGARHEGYGVQAQDYEIVGAVLITTLQEALGDDFSEEARGAWAAAFGLIATAMQSSTTN